MQDSGGDSRTFFKDSRVGGNPVITVSRLSDDSANVWGVFCRPVMLIRLHHI